VRTEVDPALDPDRRPLQTLHSPGLQPDPLPEAEPEADAGMKLTPHEIAQARQLTAETGMDLDQVIAAGEAAKAAGYRQAHQAATATTAAMRGTDLSAYPGGGPAAWVEAEPEAGG